MSMWQFQNPEKVEKVVWDPKPLPLFPLVVYFLFV